MARFIPPVVHSRTKSDGERRLFALLKADPATADWTILHSYDLPEHVRQLEGEIDFVIIVPGRGILCLSVKDCASGSRTNGMWRLGTLKPEALGPFKRADDDKFSLIARLDPQLKRWREKAPVCHAVMFTRIPKANINWERSSREWEEFEEIYSDEISRSGVAISRPILRCINGFRRKFQDLTGLPSAAQTPSTELCDKITEFLRPDFEVYCSPKSRSELVNGELKRYMTEQYACLDRASEEPRVLYRGRAGTGKTLLAIESARREALKPHNRVLVLCYNRLIAAFLRDELGPLDQTISVRTLDKHMLVVSGRSEAEDSPSFWKDLPSIALSRILESSVEEPFDSLIIDEAQDVLKTSLPEVKSDVIDILDLSLKGGLADGRWLFFADDFQSIYSQRGQHSGFDVVRYCLNSGTYASTADPLRVNCRNLPLVSEYAQILSNMNPGYSQVRRHDDGVLPTLLYYDSGESQVETLENMIRQALDPATAPQIGFTGRCKYDPSEIVVLSTKAKGQSIEGIRDPNLLSRLVKLGTGRADGIRFGTIHSFKGLEAPVVILTDVEQLASEGDEEFNRSSLLYVGITRSTERLAILAHSRVKRELEALVLGEAAT